jgi:hypothetical protein
MPLTARAPLNRLTIPCFATCYLPLPYSGDWPRRKKQLRNRRRSKTADAARWRDMALCEPPEQFLRRSGIRPDVISAAAWTQYALGWDNRSRPRFQKLRCITPMLGMSNVEEPKARWSPSRKQVAPPRKLASSRAMSSLQSTVMRSRMPVISPSRSALWLPVLA